MLKLDSTDGSAMANAYLYTELKKLPDKKLVVAFVRGIGASGSYFLAMPARRIIATHGSMIGSIGVITIRPVAEELLSKIGVRVAVARTGPLKGMGLPFIEPTEEELRKDAELVERFFQRFLNVVAEGRKVPLETVREWATGEVFWGDEALERGMIDELGDLDRATELAARMARIPEKVARVRPRRNPLLQRLVGQFSRTLARAVAMEIEQALSTRIEYRWPGR